QEQRRHEYPLRSGPAQCARAGLASEQLAGVAQRVRQASRLATVRLRQRVTKGAGSRTKGLLMAYKLLDMAQARWRRLDGAHLLPLVRAGIVLVDGVQRPRQGSKTRPRAA